MGQLKGGACVMVAVLIVLLGLATSAAAAPPDFLLQIPEGQSTSGQGAGELDRPRDIAANPDSGHIYISDHLNARIAEYTAWGLFVKAWGWGVEDGANALQTCGPSEPEAEPPPTLCKKGIAGEGEGQLDGFFGETSLALDAAGNIYVFEQENLRVQKFSAAGGFLVMFGGKVNETKVNEGAPEAQQNVCPIDDTDVCQAGTTGTAPSHFAAGTDGNYVAYSPTANAIVVGDKDRIQIFNLDGSFKEEIPFTGELADFAGESVNALEVDEAGNIYFSLADREDIYKLSGAGVPLAPGGPDNSSFEVGNPAAVAVDTEGNVYAIDWPGASSNRIFKYDAAGDRLVPTPKEEEEATKAEEEAETTAGIFFPYIPSQGPFLLGLETNICADGIEPDSESPGNLYVAFYGASISRVNGYGSAPIGCEPPPINPPEIVAQFASVVGREEATLKAQINPRFWTDATYYVEYGTGICSQGGCPLKAPLEPALLTSKSINKALSTAGVVLSDLEPGTTYRYRFVAQSSGGGPVFGVDPDGRQGPKEANEEDGLEAAFTTFVVPGQQADCANAALRTGAGAKLPDCRGYEIVSPLEKGNADVALWVPKNAFFPLEFEVHQSAPVGDRLTYTSYTSFGDSEGAAFVSQYLAQRGEAGWSSRGLSPPRATPPVSAITLLGGDFQGFSEDLCKAWFLHLSEAPLGGGAVPRYGNLYRRDNCGEPPDYLALTTEAPANRPADLYDELRVQGFSEDGSHAIFTANGKLHEDAPALGEANLQLYEHAPEGLRYVCYLPDGSPINQPCGAGTAAGSGGGNVSSTRNAISADGERIFFTAYSGGPGLGIGIGAPGRIFARIGGEQTLPVSGRVAQDPAWFWTASNDGTKAIVTFDDAGSPAPAHADELYEIDVDTGAFELIAKGAEGPLGASEDASRIYFASTEDLDGAGEGTKGAHNLYFYEAGSGGNPPTYTFVMALANADIGGYFTDPAPIDEIPAYRLARVSEDGLHAAFVSAASPTPTGYDNRDAQSGEPAVEVYQYDAVEDELRCISCNPTGARPTGVEMGISGGPLFVAARIQGWEIQNHAPRVLSEDGRRVFFESLEALVPHDTNGAWDVYQWEEAGKGGCTEASASFHASAGGCIDLISSGESPRDAAFLDADASGNNVFFGTLDSLVPQDYGLNDIYDARVGGGFPLPVSDPPCEGEACQSPPPPPPDVTPASETFEGQGNVNSSKRCRKGQRKVRRAGKVRCVSKAKRKQRQRRRAGR